jgi:hypothetical protein
MSGEWNVTYWLQRRGIEPRPDLVRSILQRAKQADRTLEEDEILALVRRHQKAGE